MSASSAALGQSVSLPRITSTPFWNSNLIVSVYMPLKADYNDLERILEAGCNVRESVVPDRGRQRRPRCAGAHAGRCTTRAFIAICRWCVAGLVLHGRTRRERGVSAHRTDLGHRIAEHEWIPVGTLVPGLGVDRELDDPEARAMLEWVYRGFRSEISVMAGQLGIELDEFRFEVDYIAANDTIDLGFMTIQKGRIAGWKAVTSGMAGGRAVVQNEARCKLTDNTTPDLPTINGYIVEIDGDPSLRCTLEPVGAWSFLCWHNDLYAVDQCHSRCLCRRAGGCQHDAATARQGSISRGIYLGLWLGLMRRAEFSSASIA